MAREAAGVLPPDAGAPARHSGANATGRSAASNSSTALPSCRVQKKTWCTGLRQDSQAHCALFDALGSRR